MLKEKKMASNKQKMERLFEAAQSVVSENRFPLPSKTQKRNELIELLDAIEAELETNRDPRAIEMRNKLLAKLDKMGVGEKELRSIRGTRAAIDGMNEGEDAPSNEDEIEESLKDTFASMKKMAKKTGSAIAKAGAEMSSPEPIKTNYKMGQGAKKLMRKK